MVEQSKVASLYARTRLARPLCFGRKTARLALINTSTKLTIDAQTPAENPMAQSEYNRTSFWHKNGLTKMVEASDTGIFGVFQMYKRFETDI